MPRYLSLSLIALVLCFAGGSADENNPKNDPTEVAVVVLKERPYTKMAVAKGRIEATTITLRPLASGAITEINFRDGDRVKKGQVLYRLDGRLAKSSLDAAKAKVASAKAALELARNDLARARKLGQSISAKELADVQTRATEAEIAVTAAESAVELAEIQLERTQIRSPLEGSVGRTMVAIGEVVQANTTQLAVVTNTEDYSVVADVPASQVKELLRVLKTDLKVNDYRDARLPVYVATGDDVGYSGRGVLDYIAHRVDVGVESRESRLLAESRTINEFGVVQNQETRQVRARLTKGKEELIPGQVASLRIPMGASKELLVPMVALIRIEEDAPRAKFGKAGAKERPGGMGPANPPAGGFGKGGFATRTSNGVYVVDENGEVAKRTIVMAKARDGVFILSSGLKLGDRIVTEPHKVQPGMRVKTKEVALPPLAEEIKQ